MSKRKKNAQTGRVGDTAEFETARIIRRKNPEAEVIETEVTTLEPDFTGLDVITKETDTASIMRARDARKLATAEQEAVRKGDDSKMRSTEPRKSQATGGRATENTQRASSDTQRATGSAYSASTRSERERPREARPSSQERVRRLKKALTPEQLKELTIASRMAKAIVQDDPKIRQERARELARELVVLMHDMGHSVEDAANFVTWVGRANAFEWKLDASERQSKQIEDDIGSLLG